MLVVWIIEIILGAVVVAFGWKYIIKPVYYMITRPRRRRLGTLDDLTGPANPGDALAEAKRELGDELTRQQTDQVKARAEEIRSKRSSTSTQKEPVK